MLHRRRRRRLDEEPRESDATGRGAAPMPETALTGSPAEMLATAQDADRASVARLIGDLEQRAGNLAVERLLATPSARAGGSDLEEEELPEVAPEAPADEVEELGAGEEERPTPTRSGTDIQVLEGEPISVTGTLREAAEQLAARAEAGSVTSQVADVYYTQAREDGPTRLVFITVLETRRMPVWTNRAKRPAPEQAEWDRFHAALAAHEQRHIEIDREVFTNLHRKCVGKSLDAMNKAIDDAIALANKRNKEFDDTTDHGRNAGTRIAPPPEEEPTTEATSAAPSAPAQAPASGPGPAPGGLPPG